MSDAIDTRSLRAAWHLAAHEINGNEVHGLSESRSARVGIRHAPLAALRGTR
jgi:hypothetical protein